jgi:hypothetical protein
MKLDALSTMFGERLSRMFVITGTAQPHPGNLSEYERDRELLGRFHRYMHRFCLSPKKGRLLVKGSRPSSR